MVWALVVCLAAPACTVTREVAIGSAREAGAFEPHARLAVTLRDGTQVRQRFVSSDAEVLVVGEAYRVTRGLDRANDPADKRVASTPIPWREIERIELIEHSEWRTALAIVVPIVVVGLAVSQMAVLPAPPP